MTARARARERGAALLIAVLLVAALSVVVGAVGVFAVLDARVAAASREAAAASAAVDAALDVTLASLAGEVDLAAVRAGAATSPASGAEAIATVDGVVDVASLTRALERARLRLPPPGDAGAWRPYLWGRLGQLLRDGVGAAREGPLVVAWVRADPAAPEADRFEVAIAAVGPGGARAAGTARVRVGPAGPGAVLSVRREPSENF